jgi:hypothetical protein
MLARRNRAEQLVSIQVDTGRHEQTLRITKLRDVHSGVGAADVDAYDLACREGGRNRTILAGVGGRVESLENFIVLGPTHGIDRVLHVCRLRIDKHAKLVLVVDEIRGVSACRDMFLTGRTGPICSTALTALPV